MSLNSLVGLPARNFEDEEAWELAAAENSGRRRSPSDVMATLVAVVSVVMETSSFSTNLLLRFFGEDIVVVIFLGARGLKDGQRPHRSASESLRPSSGLRLRFRLGGRACCNVGGGDRGSESTFDEKRAAGGDVWGAW